MIPYLLQQPTKHSDAITDGPLDDFLLRVPAYTQQAQEHETVEPDIP
jgi:hypothetical protein